MPGLTQNTIFSSKVKSLYKNDKLVYNLLEIEKSLNSMEQHYQNNNLDEGSKVGKIKQALENVQLLISLTIDHY